MNIRYLLGRATREVPGWATWIADYTRAQEHLLPQVADDLLRAADENAVILAVDQDDQNRIVGCVVLWALIQAEGRTWRELGTVFVIEEYRHSRSGLAIADRMYELAWELKPDDFILATTTNRAALELGLRAGMKHVGFAALPDSVRTATCICPSKKTKSATPANCRIRDVSCFVRVSSLTHVRLGRPPILSFPVSLQLPE